MHALGLGIVDLGITARAVGVPAPRNGRKLEMVLRDDTGTRTEERLVEVVPGARISVRW